MICFSRSAICLFLYLIYHTEEKITKEGTSILNSIARPKFTHDKAIPLHVLSLFRQFQTFKNL